MIFQSFLHGCSSLPDPYWLVIFSLGVEVIFQALFLDTTGKKINVPLSLLRVWFKITSPAHNVDGDCKVRYTHLIYK